MKFSVLLIFVFTSVNMIGQNYYQTGIMESWKIINNSDNKIVIAIIDDGVLYTHPDLVENIWVNQNEIPDNSVDDDKNGFIDDVYGWNFNNNSNDVSIGGIGNWHGTPVNGIIGAVHNNFGVSGICPNVKLLRL